MVGCMIYALLLSSLLHPTQRLLMASREFEYAQQMHVHTDTRTYTHARTHTHTCMHVHTHMHARTHTHAHTHTTLYPASPSSRYV